MVVNDGGSGESAYAYLTVHTRTVPYSHPLDVVGPALHTSTTGASFRQQQGQGCNLHWMIYCS